MNSRPNTKIEFLCNDCAVCSIDEDRAITIPLENHLASGWKSFSTVSGILPGCVPSATLSIGTH